MPQIPSGDARLRRTPYLAIGMVRRWPQVHTRGVDDGRMAQRTRLLGSWSDLDLYSGSMESEELLFEPDGTGWFALDNLAGSDRDHLAWEVVGPGRLMVRTTHQSFEPLGDYPGHDVGSPRWPEPIEVPFSFERGRPYTATPTISTF